VSDLSSDTVKCEAQVGDRFVDHNHLVAHRGAFDNGVFGSANEFIFKI
jgi:hypothetical protein